MEQLRALWRSWRKDEQWTIVLCCLVLAGLGGVAYSRQRNTMPLPPLFEEARADNSLATPQSAKDPALKTIMVHVVGAVKQPGVVTLPATARVVEAVERAGGAAPDSDVHAINLAAVLKDGQQIVVPLRRKAPPVVSAVAAVEPPRATAAKPDRPKVLGPVNVNTASAEELDALPGIGPALAGRIIAHRAQKGRFETIEDLDAVSGIGPKKLEELRQFVRF